MDKDFIAPVEAERKMSLAKRLGQNVYMYGATGYGKTTLIRQYLRDDIYEYIDCSVNEWENLKIFESGANDKEINPVSTKCVVLDNTHLIRNIEQKQKVSRLLNRKDVWVILSARVSIPSWVKPSQMSGNLILVSEDDLKLSAKEIKAFAKKQDIKLSEEEAEYIHKKAEGNAFVISLALSDMKEYNLMAGEELAEIVAREFIDYLNETVVSWWDVDIQDFMMKVSVVDSFDEELAERITNEDKIAELIERSGNAGNFLMEKDGIYYFRPIIKRALFERGYKKLGKDMMNQCHYNAGQCYEQKDDIMKALSMYEKTGDRKNIRSLLIRNGRKNPGVGFYYELRKYYLMLSEEEVSDNPVLIAALSMLYSVLMQETQSEYWYEKLRDYTEKVTGGEKREAFRRLAYLDIALPHRGSAGIVDIIKSLPKLIDSGDDTLPEMSVTNNQPSAMNGGKDFCDWSKKDKFLAATIGSLVEKMLRGFGYGIVDVALGESFYEKGVDNYEVLRHLTKAQLESQESGKIELSFVTIGIQVRLNMLLGDVNNAKRLLDKFEERIVSENARQLIPNFEALRCRIAMYTGEQDVVNEWVEQVAPDEQTEFCTLERYRYLTKLRYYIINGDYLRAVFLIGLLRVFAEKSKRTYIKMELDILESIIRYRQKQEWKKLFINVMQVMNEYSFIRIMSEEGALVYPLLKEINKDEKYNAIVTTKWFKQIISEAKLVAEHYPAYGGTNKISPIDFKPVELQLLKMQAVGKTQAEIAEELGVTIRTTKYYAAEIYKKLGVSGKTEAVQKARSLNLI